MYYNNIVISEGSAGSREKKRKIIVCLKIKTHLNSAEAPPVELEQNRTKKIGPKHFRTVRRSGPTRKSEIQRREIKNRAPGVYQSRSGKF